MWNRDPSSIPDPAHAPALPPGSASPVRTDTAARCASLPPLPPTARVECGSPWRHSLPRSCHPLKDAGLALIPPLRIAAQSARTIAKPASFLKPSVPVLRERRVMRNLLIKPQPGKPSPGQMHAQFFYQLALAGDAVQIADQQHAQQQLGIDRGPPGLAVAALQLLPYKLKTDVLVDQAQKVSFRNLVFQPEIVEQRFRAVVLPHHDQQASDNKNPAKHVSF